MTLPLFTPPPPPKTILITGASSGLGAALALAYARKDVTLFLIGRNAGRLSALADRCKKRAAEVFVATLDVRDANAMTTQLTVWDAQKPIDLVIANAGISAGTGGLFSETADQIREIFSTNLDGVVNTVLPLQNRMIGRKRGQIAVMSSMAGFRGLPGAPAYSASKAAVRSYGESLHASLKKHGVFVSVICPGFIRTPLTDVNTFPMPFLMDADKAAYRIKRGLAKGRARIAFPIPMYILTRMAEILPFWITGLIFDRVPDKPAKI